MQQLLSAILVLCLFSTLYFIVYLSAKQSRGKTMYYTLLCLAVVFYILGYLLEINATSKDILAYSLAISNMGIPALGPLFTLSIMQFFDSKIIKPWMGWLTAGHIVLVFMSVLTNRAHYLFYAAYGVKYGAWTQFIPTPGPIYIYNQVFSIIVGLLGFVYLAYKMLTISKRTAREMLLVFIGASITFIGNLFNILNVFDNNLDLIPFAGTLTVFCFFIVIVRYRLYDVLPIASRYAIETMSDAVIILDNLGHLLYYNKSATRFFPFLKTTQIQRLVNTVDGWPPELTPPFNEDQISFSVQPGSHTYHIRCFISLVPHNNKMIGYSLVCRDVSDSINLMEQLKDQAITDPLTGLYNRRYFYELLDKNISRYSNTNVKLSIIMFDLDYFKNINDTYGHVHGDQTLKEVSRIVSAKLRDSDHLARYGGEEFIILSTNTDLRQATGIAERIRRAIENHALKYKEELIKITASFGVVELEPQCGVNTTFARADKALYSAKKQGRNRVKVYVKSNKKIVSAGEIVGN